MKFKLILTSKCNWSCDYCYRVEQGTKMTTQDDSEEVENRILKFLPVIAKYTNDVFLTGGEPGMMKPKLWDFLFSEFSKLKYIRLATNGTWFKTPSYKNHGHSDKIRILYHVVQELTDEIEYLDIDFKNVIPTFVITESNIDQVGSFLKRYPKIKFFPLFALYNRSITHKEFHRKIFNVLKPFDNITDDVKKSALIMSGDDETWKEKCYSKKPLRYRIDFTKNNITTCCRPDVDVPLTEENIDLISKKIIKLPVDDRVCNYCVVRMLNNTDKVKISH